MCRGHSDFEQVPKYNEYEYGCECGHSRDSECHSKWIINTEFLESMPYTGDKGTIEKNL